MDFDKRNRDSSQGVADGDAGVGKGGRIDKNERDILSGRFLDALDKDSLGVGLQVLGVMSTSRCEIRKPLVDSVGSSGERRLSRIDSSPSDISSSVRVDSSRSSISFLILRISTGAVRQAAPWVTWSIAASNAIS